MNTQGFDPWPQRRSPLPDEAFDSLLTRVADAHRVVPDHLIRLVGLDPVNVTGVRRSQRWIHSPEPGGMRNLASALATTPDALWATTLHRYDHLLPHLAARDYSLATDARWVKQRDFALFDTSRYCPTCLTEDGYWQLSWRLGWNFACLKHGTWLHNRCPSCDQNVRKQTPVGTFICSNRSRDYRSQGVSVPCGNDLRTISPPLVDDDRLLNFQQRIEDATADTTGPDDGLLGEVRNAVRVMTKEHDRVLAEVDDGLYQWARGRSSKPADQIVPPDCGEMLGKLLAAALDLHILN